MSDKSPIDKIENVRNSLASVLVVAFIASIPLFVFKTIPEANKEIIVYMIGQLSGMALTALGFYFVNKVGQDALDAKRSDNTGAAFRAIEATANTLTPPTDIPTGTADDPVHVAAEFEGDK